MLFIHEKKNNNNNVIFNAQFTLIIIRRMRMQYVPCTMYHAGSIYEPGHEATGHHQVFVSVTRAKRRPKLAEK